MANTVTEPRYALVEVEGGFVVEDFDASKHLCSQGWSYPGVSLFESMEDVLHLRNEILN